MSVLVQASSCMWPIIRISLVWVPKRRIGTSLSYLGCVFRILYCFSKDFSFSRGQKATEKQAEISSRLHSEVSLIRELFTAQHPLHEIIVPSWPLTHYLWIKDWPESPCQSTVHRNGSQVSRKRLCPLPMVQLCRADHPPHQYGVQAREQAAVHGPWALQPGHLKVLAIATAERPQEAKRP